MAKPSLSTAKVRENAFWIYGVIVGLAIQDAASRTAQSVLDLRANPLHKWEWLPQIVRFLVVLFVAVRFYLGAVKHFSETYDDPDTSTEQREYLLDFVIGLFHFVVFYVLAATIDFQRTPGGIFPAVLGFILLYDFIWLALTRKFETTNRRVRYWAWLNLATVILMLFVYLLIWGFKPNGQPLVREAVAYSVLLLISLFEIGELVKGKGIISEWVKKKVDKLWD